MYPGTSYDYNHSFKFNCFPQEMQTRVCEQCRVGVEQCDFGQSAERLFRKSECRCSLSHQDNSSTNLDSPFFHTDYLFMTRVMQQCDCYSWYIMAAIATNCYRYCTQLSLCHPFCWIYNKKDHVKNMFICLP